MQNLDWNFKNVTLQAGVGSSCKWVATAKVFIAFRCLWLSWCAECEGRCVDVLSLHLLKAKVLVRISWGFSFLLPPSGFCLNSKAYLSWSESSRLNQRLGFWNPRQQNEAHSFCALKIRHTPTRPLILIHQLTGMGTSTSLFWCLRSTSDSSYISISFF